MKGVELKKLIQELRLYNKTPDIDISKKRITTCLLYTSPSPRDS